MPTPPPAGGCWPTPDQVLLLRAGLADAPRAREAWDRWRARNTLGAADHPSARLLPLVCKNLISEGLDEVDKNVLKGAYRATWLSNQLLIDRAAAALRALEAAGIKTMVLKGAALVVAHYGDAGARPMDDIDVLIPPGDADRALAVLRGEGWEIHPPRQRPGRRRTAHAEHLTDGRGHWLDLHWYSLATSGNDDRFWARSVEIEISGVSTRTLSPIDQLFHVAVHGGTWGELPAVRWMADAVTVSRTAPTGLDWETLVDEAIERHVTLSVTASLEHLAQDVEFPVPEAVLARLRPAPKAPFERRVYAASMRPVGRGRWLIVELDRFRRRARLDPSLGYSEFLQDYFGVGSRRELIGPLARKAGSTALVRARHLARLDRAA